MITWPQNLLDAVVEEISDMITLKRCSLASRSFVVPCQRRLFHVVVVEDTETSIRRTTQQFAAFPHLRSYVKELDITAPESKKQLKELASLLPMFQDSARMKWSGTEWPEYLVAALKESLQNPSMQSLTLMICENMAPSLLSYAATSVSQLDLSIVSLDDGAGSAAEVVPGSQLRYLSHSLADLVGTQNTILPLLPHLSGLETLEDDLSSASQFKLIMEASHKTLKKLYLRQLDFPKLAQIPRTLPMHSLCVLHLDFLSASSKLCILALLSALPLYPIITNLETLSVYISPADKVPVPTTSDLRRILDAYGALRVFEVELAWTLPPGETSSPLAEYIRRQTPTRIRVSISNRRDEE
ncbi:hypothetical protein FB45DRAFT_1108171 [Roridomyces roridus]|uniref:Uncharacterized protein n=1 Tax=Roridomyces roridus TaxID=1738132 RepID=A0AAD7BBA5_9AGAR|nr:hypothetical protein FB45DRAFT_1108171 [Roridomyces roridus]